MHPISAVAAAEDVLRTPRGGGALVFDGYCGFCTRAVLAVLRHDRGRRVRALPLQGPRVLELAGLTREAALREAWWIGADGRRCAGAAAVLAAAAAASGLPLTGLLRPPGARWVADRVYRWVAEHRGLLPGTTPHCVADPAAGCAPQPAAACGTGDRPRRRMLRARTIVKRYRAKILHLAQLATEQLPQAGAATLGAGATWRGSARAVGGDRSSGQTFATGFRNCCRGALRRYW